MTIIDGKKIASVIKDKIRNDIIKHKNKPVLAVVLIGDDPASILYVNIKEKTCKKIGIGFKKFILPKNIKEDEVINLIEKINTDKNISGFIVQLPLPNHLNTEKIINCLNPSKDIDGLGKNSKYVPPTALAIMEIFKYYNIALKNTNICLVGHGRLVGEPLANIFKKYNYKVDICTEKTNNLKNHTLNADILISATGKPGLITKDMVKNNAVIIDAGTSVEKIDNNLSSILGDVDFENVKDIASYITPPKGGVGPVTVSKLLENLSKREKL